MERMEKMQATRPDSDALKTLERLKALVWEHRVCWEVWPEQLAVKDRGPLQVGFDLVLTALMPTIRIGPRPDVRSVR